MLKSGIEEKLRLKVNPDKSAAGKVWERKCFKINESKQTVFNFSSPKSSGIFRRSRRVPLPQPASLTNL